MPWFYDSYSGKLVHEDAPVDEIYIAEAHAGLGWHILPIADDATTAQAKAYVNANLKGGAAPNPNGSISQFASNAATQLGSKATQDVASAAKQAFSLNVSQSAWLRIAEGVLGIVLIAVGIARMTGAVPVATKIAKTVG